MIQRHCHPRLANGSYTVIQGTWIMDYNYEWQSWIMDHGWQSHSILMLESSTFTALLSLQRRFHDIMRSQKSCIKAKVSCPKLTFRWKPEIPGSPGPSFPQIVSCPRTCRAQGPTGAANHGKGTLENFSCFIFAVKLSGKRSQWHIQKYSLKSLKPWGNLFGQCPKENFFSCEVKDEVKIKIQKTRPAPAVLWRTS